MAPIFARISLLATTAAAFAVQNHNGVPVSASFARTHALAAVSNDIPAGPEKKYCHPRSISFGATPSKVGRIVQLVEEEQGVVEQVERQVVSRVVQLIEEDQEVIEQVVSVAIEASIDEEKKIVACDNSGIKAAIEKEMREAIARAETGGKKYCHPKTISCFEAKEGAGVVEASFAEPVNSKPLKKYCHPKPISFRGSPIVYNVKKVAASCIVTANPTAPAIPAHVAVNAPKAQEKKNFNYFKIVKKIQKINALESVRRIVVDSHCRVMECRAIAQSVWRRSQPVICDNCN